MKYIDKYTKGVLLCRESATHQNYIVASITKITYRQIPFIVHRRDRGSGKIKEFFLCPNCRKTVGFIDPVLSTFKKVIGWLGIALFVILAITLAVYYTINDGDGSGIVVLVVLLVLTLFFLLFSFIIIKDYYIPPTISIKISIFETHKIDKMKTVDESSLLDNIGNQSDQISLMPTKEEIEKKKREI